MLDRVLRQLKADGVTIVAVTHRPSLLALADRVLRLRDGQMEQLEMPTGSQQQDSDSSSGIRQTDHAEGMPPGINLAELRAGRSPLQAAKVPSVERVMGGGQ